MNDYAWLLKGRKDKSSSVYRCMDCLYGALPYAKYIFDGSHVKANLHVKVSDKVTTFLPRFGLKFSLPEQFED